MPRKKISDVSQTHGKQEKFVPTTLDQVWGDTGINRYKTMETEDYSRFLTELNKSDLQAHAVKVGVLPTDNRDMLTKKLLAAFKNYVAAYRKPNIELPNSSKVSDKTLRILSEGR
jgi:hypothetical protein